LAATTIGAMLLYDSAVSGNCYKVRLLLSHLGLSYERRPVDVIDRSNRAELLGGLNPALRVPTLVLDDGRSLAESNAILWHFAEDTAYLPEDRFERAKVLQWLFFEQYSHEPYIAVLRFWLAVAKLSPTEDELDAKRKGGDAAWTPWRASSSRGRISSEALTRSPTSRCMRTRMSPTRQGSISTSARRRVPGWSG
jgi:glutathione S-transferase